MLLIHFILGFALWMCIISCSKATLCRLFGGRKNDIKINFYITYKHGYGHISIGWS